MNFIGWLFLSFLSLACFSCFLPKKYDHIKLILTIATIIFIPFQLIEHYYRWQILLSYVLVFLLLIVNLTSKIYKYKNVYKILICAFLVIVWFVSLSFPIIVFPKPSGVYNVGTKIFWLEDEERLEWFTKKSNDKRTVMAQLWYPAADSPQKNESYYIDYPSIRLAKLAEKFKIPQFLISHFRFIKTNSILGAEPLKSDSPFPLLVFSPGISGTKTQNTALMEELASNGYMVFAIDHTYDAYITIFPDGSVADYRSKVSEDITDSTWLKIRTKQLDVRDKDIQFIILKALEMNGNKKSDFYGSIDTNNIGVLGHSFGGATSVLSALNERRVKASVALDGWFVPLSLEKQKNSLQVPFMYLGQESWPNWHENRNILQLNILLKNSNEDTYHFAIKNSSHYDYSDIPLLSPFTVIFGMTKFSKRGRVVKIVNHLTLDFFNKYLKKKNNTVLDKQIPYSEVIDQKKN